MGINGGPALKSGGLPPEAVPSPPPLPSLRLALAKRLFTAFAVVSALGLAALALALTLRTETRLKESADISLGFFAAALTQPLWNYDASAIRSIGEGIAEDNSIAIVSIRDQEGRLLYGHSRPGALAFASKPRGRDIFHAEIMVGRVEISYSRLGSLRNLLIVFLAWAGILVAALATMKIELKRLVERFLVDPIGETRRMSERFAAGDFSSPELKPSFEEFEPFAESLERMASTIQGQFGEISAANATLEEALREKDLLLRELQHRIKNNLQQLAALSSMDSAFKETEEARSVRRASERRIQVMAELYDLCSNSDSVNEVYLGSFLETVCRLALPQRPALPLELKLDAGATAPMDRALLAGLLVAELVSVTASPTSRISLSVLSSELVDGEGGGPGAVTSQRVTMVGLEVREIEAKALELFEKEGRGLLGILEDELGAAISMDDPDRRLALSFSLQPTQQSEKEASGSSAC
jgi:hypothetical protein